MLPETIDERRNSKLTCLYQRVKARLDHGGIGSELIINGEDLSFIKIAISVSDLTQDFHHLLGLRANLHLGFGVDADCVGASERGGEGEESHRVV